MLATLTSKGQLTLPALIRAQLHLKPGDKIEFLTKPDGHIEGIPVRKTVDDLKGILPKPPVPVSLDEMEQVIADGANDVWG
jgi:antitoxin PrlF